MQIQRSVETPAAPAAVFAYLSDFTTTNEWDPGTVRTTLLSGDGGAGTKYRNVSKFAGRETELTYEVIEHRPDSRYVIQGENKTVVARDTIDIEPAGTGSRVTYTADFEFRGVAKYAAPLLAPAFKKLGDEAEEGLRDALAKL
ncbi:SRPBCC family protein [Nocardioides bigeumensis]|uniref:SRPBCC family protein n=1 Tax=Nocardioides bigeumensis TaxID=433657 RepID=A0ABN2YEC2_9ACTN